MITRGEKTHYRKKGRHQSVKKMSNSSTEGRQFWGDKVFAGAILAERERLLVLGFLESHDFSPNTFRAFAHDLNGFIRWFNQSSGESFVLGRVTTSDIAAYKRHLRDERGLAIASVNRCLAMIRKFFGWLLDQGEIGSSPVTGVKELHQVELAPQGLDRNQARRLLRECELRGDVRATAIFSTLLFTGCRCGDLVGLELDDLVLSERSGWATFRRGKGGKQRRVPLPLITRKAIQAWLAVRPAIGTKVFVGCRGPLTDRGVRVICSRYSCLLGIRIFPHACRHSFAHRFLEDNANDLVSLAQLLGHTSLNTTKRYSLRRADQLAECVERIGY